VKQNKKHKAMTTETLKYDQIFKGIYTPFNLEKIMIEKLKAGVDLSELKQAANFFYKMKQINRNEKNWFVDTSIEILKECYL
jgi:predicted nuclease of restriction endonuclease-like (RecB) superfamily